MLIYKYLPDYFQGADNFRHVRVALMGKCWMRLPRAFNDPFDSHIFFGHHENQEALGEVKRICEILVYVSCFSKTVKNMLMWAHYANNHKGVCFEYEIGDTDNQLKDFEKGNVIYRSEPHIVNAAEFIKNYQSNFQDQARMESFIREIYFNKSIDWAYEEEYRVLSLNQNLTRDNVADGMEVDFISPKSIYFGARSNEEYIDEFKKLLDEMNCGRLNTYRTRLHSNQYDIEKI